MAKTIKSTFLSVKKYLSNQALITDLVTKLVITFGVTLIVSGLYLMIVNPGTSAQTNSAQSAISASDWIPGIPFYIGAISNVSAITVGSVSWILGIDSVLVGLGLWIRHRFARFAGILIFTLAAFFQFIQVLYFGLLGSPVSVIEFLIDASFVYFLFSKFDMQTVALNSQANNN